MKIMGAVNGAFLLMVFVVAKNSLHAHTVLLLIINMKMYMVLVTVVGFGRVPKFIFYMKMTTGQLGDLAFGTKIITD